MKVYVSVDEWYPVHTVSEKGWVCEMAIELTPEEFAECQKCEAAFNEWQDKLSALYDAAKVRSHSEIYEREKK